MIHSSSEDSSYFRQLFKGPSLYFVFSTSIHSTLYISTSRHKDKIRERSQRRKREESASRKRSSDDSGIGGFSSAINIISKLRGQREEDYQYGKNRSSSLESSSSTHTDADFNRIQNITGGIFERRKSSPFVMDNAGVITASLTIPVQTQANQGTYGFE